MGQGIVVVENECPRDVGMPERLFSTRELVSRPNGTTADNVDLLRQGHSRGHLTHECSTGGIYINYRI